MQQKKTEINPITNILVFDIFIVTSFRRKYISRCIKISPDIRQFNLFIFNNKNPFKNIISQIFTDGHAYGRLNGHTDIRTYHNCNVIKNFVTFFYCDNIRLSGINNQSDIRQPAQPYWIFGTWKEAELVHRHCNGNRGPQQSKSHSYAHPKSLSKCQK